MLLVNWIGCCYFPFEDKGLLFRPRLNFQSSLNPRASEKTNPDLTFQSLQLKEIWKVWRLCWI